MIEVNLPIEAQSVEVEYLGQPRRIYESVPLVDIVVQDEIIHKIGGMQFNKVCAFAPIMTWFKATRYFPVEALIPATVPEATGDALAQALTSVKWEPLEEGFFRGLLYELGATFTHWYGTLVGYGDAR